MDEPLLSNNAMHDNNDATSNNIDNHDELLLQTTAKMNSPSTNTAPSLPAAIKKKSTTARRQSLRSYLQNVSLTDAIVLHPPANNNTNTATVHSPEKKTSGKNRRRRLEVMGLLQHLKIHRYEDASASFAANAVDKKHHNNANTTNSSGGDDNDTKVEDTNNKVKVTSGDRYYSAGNNIQTNSNNNNKSISIQHNPTHQGRQQQQQQRCLLHPTVRLRNDKCSLCCALTKTLEVRSRVKLLENGLLDDDGGMVLMDNDNDDDDNEGKVLFDAASSASSANGFFVKETTDATSSTTIVKKVPTTRHDVEETASESDKDELLHEEIDNHSLEFGEDKIMYEFIISICWLVETVARR